MSSTSSASHSSSVISSSGNHSVSAVTGWRAEPKRLRRAALRSSIASWASRHALSTEYAPPNAAKRVPSQVQRRPRGA
ncbi:hypothetical protein ACTD5D_07290 [Nocardia takedensis]|uniref:hypothetical protein n=1 Tax=Nocardia takedensis TaxID=259390 RepID=UPI003F75764B